MPIYLQKRSWKWEPFLPLSNPPTSKRTFFVNYFSVFWIHFKESGWYLKGFFQSLRHYHMNSFDLISITTANQLGILFEEFKFLLFWTISTDISWKYHTHIHTHSLLHGYIVSKPCSIKKCITNLAFKSLSLSKPLCPQKCSRWMSFTNAIGRSPG